ncbi:MAG: Cys-tRNA(Pro) deacylase [Oscillospiraceae bacterium]|nr:Cys-tRNA(Pro) deacylase [Oscillospiraceae bacterium]
MAKKAKQQDEKTNVMRILEQKGIPYTAKTYPHEEGVAVDGVTVAESLGQDPDSVFKTLVTRGASGTYYVFDIPVAEELDLKKAAKAVQEKNIAMLHVVELLPLTGYVRGGCSPVGMKKPFFTTFQETAILFEEIAVSAGKIGVQVIVEPNALCELVEGQFADVVKDG